MAHFDQILVQHDAETTLYLKYQISVANHPHRGAFVLPDNVIDTRNCGFLLAHRYYSQPNSRQNPKNRLQIALTHNYVA